MLLTPQDSSSFDNGCFDLLPGEVIFNILSYLPLNDICKLAQVSTLFYRHCYNPLLPQHQHLNLQPYWFILTKSSLDGFVTKCKRIRSLRLSWCGAHNDMLNSQSLLQIVQVPTLCRLDLSCCALTDELFKSIIPLCQNLTELDVSSTLKYLSCSSLQVIAILSKLVRWEVKLYLSALCCICS